ncbi:MULTISPECIES: ferredoxin [unclassified Brevibacterium]|uniref:ferredoxin n=1 Tax=unclassified Brevibacterium TaxID=2614124 RepID=UPI000C6BB6CB|nr:MULTISPECIES: ferredoxin [unclassified Brevibacterium]SMX93714.1 Ferredoxin [Brevibacterium sp. 239c]
MRIELDQDACIGAGNCVITAPDLFDQRDDDGVAFLLEENPSPEQESSAKEAEALCPAAAIRIHKK